MLRKCIFIFFVAISFSVFACASAVFVLKTWGSRQVGAESTEVIFRLDKGASLRDVSSKLKDVSLVSSDTFFLGWVRIFSNYQQFKAGRYKFELPISPERIASKLIEGDTFDEVVHQVSIPEGFTLNQVIERFIQNGIGLRSKFVELSTNTQSLREFGISAGSIEGYLYPATYSFYETPDEVEVFRVMTNTFWKRLPKDYEVKVAAYGVTLHQAVILASLIEAETLVPEEKPKVAEVLLNRLNIGMTLGIDAALIYGIPNFDGDLRSADLKDRSNPYNLRLRKGLPPTPINSPTESSLEAILNATREGYLYYVLDPTTGKTHTFTRSHKDHSNAVRKLVASGK